MTRLFCLFIISFSLLSCNSKPKDGSIWRDHNAPDTTSFYSEAESCDRILGNLKYKTILHKGFEEEDVFGGLLVVNSMEIRRDSAFYKDVNGALIDYGACSCENAVLSINWTQLFKRKIDYEIHFNDSILVELRYADYHKTMDYYFTRDSTLLFGRMNNPTKILGEIHP